MKDNAKKLGLILSGIVFIIIIILLIYFITYLFDINHDKPIITTTTTRRVDEGFKNISDDEKNKFNEEFNKNNLLIAFNNAFENNYNTKNINLLELEENKFKFVYTYLKLNNISDKINHEIINTYSQKFFKTELYSENFYKYLKNGYYDYEIKYPELNYCLKANKIKDNTLLLDMITRSENNCDINLINYEKALVVHQVKLTYEIIDNDYIYKSFIVVK